MKHMPAPDLLAHLQSVVGSSLNRHLSTTTEWFPHEFVPYEQGRNFLDEPWTPSDSRLDDVAQTALEVNLLTEDNLPYYHLAIWETFGGDGPWAEWIRDFLEMIDATAQRFEEKRAARPEVAFAVGL